MMKFSTRRLLVVVVVLAGLLVAACGPAPLGTSWPAVTLIQDQCGETTRTGILVAYLDRVVVVNPANGRGMPLLNPTNCETRQDNNGNLRVWDFRSGGKQFFTLPLEISDEKMLVVSYDQHLIQVNPTLVQPVDGNAAGVPITTSTGHVVTDPVLSDDTIYVSMSAKDVIALDRETFDRRWTFTTEHGVWAKPLLVENTLYFASLDHNLYAVNAETGAEIWRLDLGGAATATPTLHDGKLYIGSFARKVYEISAEDGTILNSFDTLDWVWGAPTIVDEVLYTADLVGNVYAIDISNGMREIWTQKVATAAIRPSPLVVGGVVIVASRDQKVYWLNARDGSIRQDDEGNPMVRELQASIFSDILLIEPSESVDIDEPIIVVSTTANNQILVAYALDNAASKWEVAYAFQ